MAAPPKEVTDRARKAKQLLIQLQAQGTIRLPTNSIADYVQLGTELWEQSYKRSSNDIDALQHMIDWANDGYQSKSATRMLMHKLHLDLPDEQCRYMWLARWVDQGCPRIVVESKYAALLMATDVGKAHIEHVIPPWHAFLIEMPPGLISIENEKGAIEPISKLLFQAHVTGDGARVCNMMGIGEAVSIWRYNTPLVDLASDRLGEETTDWGTGIEVTSRDDRAVSLMGRLVISACVALMDSGNYHRQKGSKGRSQKHRTAKGLTEIQTFVLGKPVSINCREMVLDFLEGRLPAKRGPMSVQGTVRGHWKYQPYGPNSSLRKFMHIEPYWRGPEDARILTRVVELEKPPD